MTYQKTTAPEIVGQIATDRFAPHVAQDPRNFVPSVVYAQRLVDLVVASAPYMTESALLQDLANAYRAISQMENG